MSLELFEERLGIKVNRMKLLTLFNLRNKKIGEFSREDVCKILDVVGFQHNLDDSIIEAGIAYCTGTPARDCMDMIQSPESIADLCHIALHGVKDRVVFDDSVIQIEGKSEVLPIPTGDDVPLNYFAKEQ